MWGLELTCFTMSVRHTAAANTLVLLAANPLWASLFSCVMLQHEKAAVRTWVCMGFVAAAVLLIFSEQFDGKGALGLAFGLCASILVGLLLTGLVQARGGSQISVNESKLRI